MKIAIIGATGHSGQAILKEAISRSYQVTAIVRNKSKLPQQTIPVIEKDLFQLTGADLAGFDVVVDAFRAPDGQEILHQTSLAHLTAILAGQKTRLLIVGGAGSLYLDESLTTRVMDTPDFPAAYMPTANNMAKALDKLRSVTDVNWTYLSPAAFYNPDGARTGQYQAAGEVFTLNAAGKSEISYADYAIALVDEMAQAQHIKHRFSVVSA